MQNLGRWKASNKNGKKPIVVLKEEEEMEPYEIVAGERRWSSQKASSTMITITILDLKRLRL